MMIAVPAGLVASPLKNGRDLGESDRSALVIGGTEEIRTGGAVVFVKVVAVTEAQVRRDGQVRAKGSPVHHAALGTTLDARTRTSAERTGLAGRWRRRPVESRTATVRGASDILSDQHGARVAGAEKTGHSLIGARQ